MAAGTGMAGDVAAMAASASVHSQPMAPGDMQVWRSGFFCKCHHHHLPTFIFLTVPFASGGGGQKDQPDRKLSSADHDAGTSLSLQWRPILSNLGLELPLLRKKQSREKDLMKLSRWSNRRYWLSAVEKNHTKFRYSPNFSLVPIQPKIIIYISIEDVDKED